MCAATTSWLRVSSYRTFLVSACLCFVFCGVAQGEGINVPLDGYGYPNLFSTCEPWGMESTNGITYTVQGGTGFFHAEGCPQSYSVNSGSQSDIGADGVHSWPDDCIFALDVKLTPTDVTPSVCSGVLKVVGSLGSWVDGVWVSQPGQSGILLEGDVVQCGASINNTDENVAGFDFLVHITGGDLASDYGSTAYIILSPGYGTGDGFDGSMSSDFTFSDGGVVDIQAIVPEPSSGALALALITGLVATPFSRRLKMWRGV
jgi:hypothetical protein